MSIATVSRVLNGTAKVSDETRERVLAQAAELDYVPSAAARTLVTRRSQVLGIVLNTGDDHPDIGHPFFQDVLTGLKHSAGISATTCSSSPPTFPRSSCDAHSTTGSTG